MAPAPMVCWIEGGAGFFLFGVIARRRRRATGSIAAGTWRPRHSLGVSMSSSVIACQMYKVFRGKKQLTSSCISRTIHCKNVSSPSRWPPKRPFSPAGTRLEHRRAAEAENDRKSMRIAQANSRCRDALMGGSPACIQSKVASSSVGPVSITSKPDSARLISTKMIHAPSIVCMSPRIEPYIASNRRSAAHRPCQRGAAECGRKFVFHAPQIFLYRHASD